MKWRTYRGISGAIQPRYKRKCHTFDAWKQKVPCDRWREKPNHVEITTPTKNDEHQRKINNYNEKTTNNKSPSARAHTHNHQMTNEMVLNGKDNNLHPITNTLASSPSKSTWHFSHSHTHGVFRRGCCCERSYSVSMSTFVLPSSRLRQSMQLMWTTNMTVFFLSHFHRALFNIRSDWVRIDMHRTWDGGSGRYHWYDASLIDTYKWWIDGEMCASAHWTTRRPRSARSPVFGVRCAASPLGRVFFWVNRKHIERALPSSHLRLSHTSRDNWSIVVESNETENLIWMTTAIRGMLNAAHVEK